MATHTVDRVDVSQFKSPLRALVRFFRESRDNWKKKYMDVKAEIKRYKNQANDARKSRDKWKAQAKTVEAKNRRLESELDELRSQQEANKKPSRRYNRQPQPR